MAITKATEVSKIDITGDWAISVRTDTVISEEGEEISRSPHRHTIVPFISLKEGDSWVHTPMDLSSEHVKVKAVAEALWTDEAKTHYKAVVEAS